MKGLSVAAYEGAQWRAGFAVFGLAREGGESRQHVDQQDVDRPQFVAERHRGRLAAHIAFVLKTLFALISPESRLKR